MAELMKRLAALNPVNRAVVSHCYATAALRDCLQRISLVLGRSGGSGDESKQR